MIRVQLNGRLGNQLFIYAFTRKCMEIYNQPALIYDRKKEADSKWYSHLDGYKLNENVKFTSDKSDIRQFNLKQKLLYMYHFLRTRKMTQRERHEFQKKMFDVFFKEGFILYHDGYIDIPNKEKKDIYIEGYFQSAKFFDDIRDKLLQEIKPREEHTEEEKELIQKIDNTESVCLTIRLGDYIGNTTHQVCTKEFYKQAMEQMHRLYPNCVFYAFSDEVNRLREIFDFDYEVIYDSGKSRDIQSLDVMAHCKHFIISNSSFSWWAQYLSTNPNKTVIAPSRWYAADVPTDIMQSEWKLIEC